MVVGGGGDGGGGGGGGGGGTKSLSCQTQLQLRFNWVELTLKLGCDNNIGLNNWFNSLYLIF